MRPGARVEVVNHTDSWGLTQKQQPTTAAMDYETKPVIITLHFLMAMPDPEPLEESNWWCGGCCLSFITVQLIWLLWEIVIVCGSRLSVRPWHHRSLTLSMQCMDRRTGWRGSKQPGRQALNSVKAHRYIFFIDQWTSFPSSHPR